MGGGNTSPEPDSTADFSGRETQTISQSPRTGTDTTGEQAATTETSTETGQQTNASTSNSTTGDAGTASDSTADGRAGSEKLTSDDTAEIAATNRVSEPVVPNRGLLTDRSITEADVMTAPTPGEFARNTFSAGTRSRQVQAGSDGHAATVQRDTGELHGSWEAFSRDDIDHSEPLGDVLDTGAGGRTKSEMEVVKLSSESPTAATEGYVSNYEQDEFGLQHPGIENAHSRMSIHAGLEAMGVETPRHVFDDANKQVIVESVDRPGYDAVTATADDLTAEYANEIDEEQLTEVMAANAMFGNLDFQPDNIMIGEDGTAIMFDYDYTRSHTGRTAAETANRAQSGLTDVCMEINAHRDENIEITSDDLSDKMEELATELDDTGMKNRVMAALQEWDTFFATQDINAYNNHGNPIGEQDGMAKQFQRHVEQWSNT